MLLTWIVIVATDGSRKTHQRLVAAGNGQVMARAPSAAHANDRSASLLNLARSLAFCLLPSKECVMSNHDGGAEHLKIIGADVTEADGKPLD